MTGDSVPLTNGHEKSEDVTLSDSLEAAHDVIVLKQQLTELQVNVARQTEQATIETLVQDAMGRYVKAMEAGNHRAAIECAREIFRLELYLSRRGFV